MDQLILRSLSGEALPSEEAALQRWRAASADNERRYREIRRVWELTGHVNAVSQSSPLPEAKEIIREAESRHARGSVSQEHWKRNLRMGLVAAAAVAAILLVPQLLSDRGDGSEFGSLEVLTEASDKGVVTLTDGSVVRLGPRTSLRFAQPGEKRAVTLEGRAYFAVESDVSRPFTVRTPHGEATALGTRFEVNVMDTETRVLVVEGRVRVTQGYRSVDLEAGQMARAAADSSLTLLRIPESQAQPEWLDDVLIFKSTPLRKAVREVERRYGVTVDIVSSPLAQRTVTGTFLDESFEDVMNILCRVVEASCEVEETSATMRTKDAADPGRIER